MKTADHQNKDIDLSIIIINYNLSVETENCITSLFRNSDLCKKINFEVIIVDNNSPDKKLQEVERKFSSDNILFFYLDKNLGFGKGCNFGFSKSSGKYICFLNPDTIINEDIFTPVLNLFEKDHSIGIIGPRQQTKAPFFDFSAGFYPNLFYEFFNLFGAGVFLEGFIMFFYTKLKGMGKTNVSWILGAAIFIRAELFASIEGFDKDYFMFSEEVDLCKRVSNKGFEIIYFPTLRIHHIGSVSGKKDYKLFTIRTYASKKIYISKHYKSVYKFLMKILLFVQLFSQILIWIILFPLNRNKSKQKISAFIYLIKNRMRYEYRY